MYILWSDKKLTTSFFCGTWCFVLTWQNNWSSKGMQDTFSILKDFYKNQKWYFVSKSCPVLLCITKRFLSSPLFLVVFFHRDLSFFRILKLLCYFGTYGMYSFSDECWWIILDKFLWRSFSEIFFWPLIF